MAVDWLSKRFVECPQKKIPNFVQGGTWRHLCGNYTASVRKLFCDIELSSLGIFGFADILPLAETKTE